MLRVSSSFRDPSGYVFEDGGIIYRKVAESYLFIFFGWYLYPLLPFFIVEGLLLPFEVVGNILKPEQIPFISYPYEWSFSMLKDAALLTLRTQKIALEYNYTLKDASAYNVQFVGGSPVLIDHLSFYPYSEGKPWVAYSQFCKHFLAPLSLAAYRDVGFIKKLLYEIDGLKLGSASHLLPSSAWLRLGLLLHLKLNGIDTRAITPRLGVRVSKFTLTSLVSSLEATIKNLNWKPPYGWKDYEKECNYSDEATHKKAYIVEEDLRRIDSK